MQIHTHFWSVSYVKYESALLLVRSFFILKFNPKKVLSQVKICWLCTALPEFSYSFWLQLYLYFGLALWHHISSSLNKLRNFWSVEQKTKRLLHAQIVTLLQIIILIKLSEGLIDYWTPTCINSIWTFQKYRAFHTCPKILWVEIEEFWHYSL